MGTLLFLRLRLSVRRGLRLGPALLVVLRFGIVQHGSSPGGRGLLLLLPFELLLGQLLGGLGRLLLVVVGIAPVVVLHPLPRQQTGEGQGGVVVLALSALSTTATLLGRQLLLPLLLAAQLLAVAPGPGVVIGGGGAGAGSGGSRSGLLLLVAPVSPPSLLASFLLAHLVVSTN